MSKINYISAVLMGKIGKIGKDIADVRKSAAAGAPTKVTLVSQMTDTDKNYLYIGSETGYTSGHVYYYVDGNLTDGGAYGGVNIDNTLSVSGQAADAKVTGDEIEGIKEDLSTKTGLSEEAKQALLACFAKVAWIDENGQDYYDALEDALYPPTNLVRISAVYTQSGTVYTTDSLDTLKPDLVVTAHYSDNTSSVVTGYALSGTLTEGACTVAVSYSGKTTTFTVTVTAAPLYDYFDYIRYTGQDCTEPSTASPMIITTKQFTDLNSLIFDFDWSPAKTIIGTVGILGGHHNGGGTGNAYYVSFYGDTSRKRVSVFSHGTALGINDNPNVAVGSVVHVNLNPGTASPSTLTVDELNVTGAWTATNAITGKIGYFGQWDPEGSTLKNFAQVGRLKLYDLSNNLVGDYRPCKRNADGVVGVYDEVDGIFYTAENIAYTTLGGASCVYELGNWED